MEVQERGSADLRDSPGVVSANEWWAQSAESPTVLAVAAHGNPSNASLHAAVCTRFFTLLEEPDRAGLERINRNARASASGHSSVSRLGGAAIGGLLFAARRRTVPRLACLIFITTFVTACGDSSPSGPSPSGPELTEVITTAHFEFRYSRSDSVDVAWQEAFHEWATRELQVTISRRIVYSKYLTPHHMLALHNGPGNVNAWADPDRFMLHTIWPTDNHETIHLYSSTMGRMTSLFNEGLAVAFQVDPVRGDMTPRWNNRHVHDIAASLRASGRLVRLDSILTIDGFRGLDSQVSYPVAGSFVRYLWDVRGGIEPVRKLFTGSTQADPPALVRSKFEAAYGRSLEALETEWHAFLDAR